jgi:proteasome lid subunit RPN8/RPN11
MLQLPRRLYEEIIAHCQQQYPKEACGILAGTRGEVERVFAMTNVDNSPISYALDPKEQLQVQRALMEAKLDLLAIYHSHTASAAYPSPVDVARASEPGVALLMPDVRYVLVSLNDRQQPEVKSYAIRDGRVVPDELRIG